MASIHITAKELLTLEGNSGGVMRTAEAPYTYLFGYPAELRALAEHLWAAARDMAEGKVE